MPEDLVKQESDGYYSLDYSQLLAPMIRSQQGMFDMIISLMERIAKLEAVKMKHKANLTDEEIRKVETMFPELEKMEEAMDILIRGMLRKEPSKDMMQRFDDFLSASVALSALENGGRKRIHLENMSVDNKLEYLQGIIDVYNTTFE
ncbi:hypothetical protein HK104_006223 [Borealophlyctis nickersoniae]|nr:hypothetical protein HK104_006223 [Borealophlyctis nickersoniae]